jgi:TolA protein
MKNSALSEKALYLNPLKTGEGNLFAFFLFASLATHLGFFMVRNINFFEPQDKPMQQELAIEASLITDFDLDGAQETTIPDAKEADEVAIRDNLLPQLTKKFSIEEEKIEDDAIADFEADVKDGNVKKKIDEPDLKIKSDKDESNKITKLDALKRLAIEKLRQEKKDIVDKAKKTDPLAKIREELTKKNSKILTAGGLSGKKALDRYRILLQKSVRRNYELPEAYNFKNTDLSVVISIKVTAKGELMQSLVAKSSGDEVFDELAFSAVKKSAPLPFPPKDQVGQLIHLKFSPKSF